MSLIYAKGHYKSTTPEQDLMRQGHQDKIKQDTKYIEHHLFNVLHKNAFKFEKELHDYDIKTIGKYNHCEFVKCTPKVILSLNPQYIRYYKNAIVMKTKGLNHDNIYIIKRDNTYLQSKY